MGSITAVSVGILCLLFPCFGTASKSDVELSFLSWNVNGVKKFQYLPNEVRFMRSHDVIFLQETFSEDVLDLFELSGYLSHHLKAKLSTRGRNFWGLSTLFRRENFKNGTIES